MVRQDLPDCTQNSSVSSVDEFKWKRGVHELRTPHELDGMFQVVDFCKLEYAHRNKGHATIKHTLYKQGCSKDFIIKRGDQITPLPLPRKAH